MSCVSLYGSPHLSSFWFLGPMQHLFRCLMNLALSQRPSVITHTDRVEMLDLFIKRGSCGAVSAPQYGTHIWYNMSAQNLWLDRGQPYTLWNWLLQPYTYRAVHFDHQQRSYFYRRWGWAQTHNLSSWRGQETAESSDISVISSPLPPPNFQHSLGKSGWKDC